MECWATTAAEETSESKDVRPCQYQPPPSYLLVADSLPSCSKCPPCPRTRAYIYVHSNYCNFRHLKYTTGAVALDEGFHPCTSRHRPNIARPTELISPSELHLPAKQQCFGCVGNASLGRCSATHMVRMNISIAEQKYFRISQGRS